MMKANKQTISKNGCRCNSISTAKRRREYLPLIFSPLTIELDNTILTGSVMEKPVRIEQVEIQDFENGFEGLPESDFTVTFD